MAYGPFDLSGKTALVTGGNGGIGLGMADAMAQSGANVCIWGTNAEKNAAALEQLSTQVRQRPAAEDPLESSENATPASEDSLRDSAHSDDSTTTGANPQRAWINGLMPALKVPALQWRPSLFVAHPSLLRDGPAQRRHRHAHAPIPPKLFQWEGHRVRRVRDGETAS